jgi:hypothetical protein
MSTNNVVTNNNNNSSAVLTRLIPVILIFLGLLGLYYLYQYLFGPKTMNAYPLITATQSAETLPGQPLIFSSTQLAPLYEGGEFTLSTWIYISNWNYRANRHKSIMRIGSIPWMDDVGTGMKFDTIRLYLGASTPKLHVKLDSYNSDMSMSGFSELIGDSLDIASYTSIYDNVQIDSGLRENRHSCDISELPLQRWVNIAVAVNGKIVDVYIDGKLSRSCVLPYPFRVDSSGYAGVALEKTGFGGQISTTTMYDTALNPEAVYKNYMAGPEPITSIGGLLSSMFAPNVNISITHDPK